MLQYILNSAAMALSVALLVPTAIFAIECIAGSLKLSTAPWKSKRRPTVSVLVPAHNEEQQIVATVINIRGQMRDGDRLVVVADNCSDLTASHAREAGAEVVERFDTTLRGKGYALDAGVKYLAGAPSEVVVILDADCWMEPGALDELAIMAAATNRPQQSRYLMVAPANAGISLAVSEFAFFLKNATRLRGLARLGLPAQLTGSGMAFPWPVLQASQLASSNLVEDMKLGLDLARAGHAPLFCDAAVVRSEFPYSRKGHETQASRWEAGRFALARPLLSALLDVRTFANIPYLALVIDALIPPLTLLVALLVMTACLMAVLSLAGLTMLPLAISAGSMLLLGVALVIAWWRDGKGLLPPRRLMEIPRYAIGKLKRYPQQMFGSAKLAWIRTDREKPTDA